MRAYYSDDAVTLYCGDCRDVGAWLGADVLVTDPPYGTDNHGGYGRRQLGLQTIANDSDATVRDAVLALWGDRPAAVFASPRAIEPPGEWPWRLVWDKGRPGLGSPWRWGHELVYVRGGWENDPGVPSVLRYSAPPEMRSALHPHEKPLRLLVALLTGAPGVTVADPFCGSGSTLVAAKNLNRKAIGIDIEERYCEVAAKRLAQGVLELGA